MDDDAIDFKSIIEHARDVVIVTRAWPIDEPGPEIVYVNPAFTELTGYSAEEALGNNPRMLQGEPTDPKARETIRQALVNQASVRTRLKNFSKDGREYWLELVIVPLRDSRGQVTHFAAIERDVTEQKQREEELLELTRTDPLTGADNRRAFERLASSEFYRFKRRGHSFALLMLDIDHFKAFNDSHGHDVGDHVLREVTRRCSEVLRQHDTFARIGGEEFAVLLPYTGEQDAARIAERLRRCVAATQIPTESETLSVTVSLGVAVVAADDADFEDVLRRADQALYQAKDAGRDCVRGA